MKQILLCIIFCLITSFGQAQVKISFKDLEKLFLENNPAAKARRAELKVFAGRKTDAGKRPNPSLNASVESLSKGTRETETSVTIAQELDLNHTRHWFVRSLEHEQNASRYQLNYELRLEIAELKKQFCKALLLEKDVAALKTVLTTISEMESKTRLRLADGDVSEIDVMRLTAEKHKVGLLIEDIKNEADIERRLLATSLGITTTTIDLADNLPPITMDYDSDSLYSQSLENRADLRAAKEKLLSGESSIIAAKKQARSPLTFEGGYKARNGGFKGFILGISTPLPFSNRNKGKIDELQAQNSAEELRIEAIQKELSGKIDATIARLSFLADRQSKQIQQIEELKKIARIARLNFEESDEGLIEILDAVRGQSDLILELNRTIMDSWHLVFDLETVTGLNLTHNGDKE